MQHTELGTHLWVLKRCLLGAQQETERPLFQLQRFGEHGEQALAWNYQNSRCPQSLALNRDIMSLETRKDVERGEEKSRSGS